MPLAPSGNAQQFCSVFNFQLVFRGLFFTVLRALPKNTGRLGASIGNAQYKGRKKNIDLMAAFRLFGRTLPIHFALMGRKWKYVKSKTIAKLIEKRTSIAAV
jgi:hypothetical protein